MKLIQLIKDFRKWREEKYRQSLLRILARLDMPNHFSQLDKELTINYDHDTKKDIWQKGVMLGVLYSKEILKKVKI